MREGQRDYVGSVRIPMRELMMNEAIADNFPVKDEFGNEMGRMEVKLTCKDYNPYPYESEGGLKTGDSSGFTVSKFTEREIITKIAEKFASAPIDDIDLIFDMLLTGNDTNKISKGHFKDYALMNLNIRENEIDILLKTNSHVQGKDFIERSDFKNIFEAAIRQAKQKQVEQITMRT